MNKDDESHTTVSESGGLTTSSDAGDVGLVGPSAPAASTSVKVVASASALSSSDRFRDLGRSKLFVDREPVLNKHIPERDWDVVRIVWSFAEEKWGRPMSQGARSEFMRILEGTLGGERKAAVASLCIRVMKFSVNLGDFTAATSEVFWGTLLTVFGELICWWSLQSQIMAELLDFREMGIASRALVLSIQQTMKRQRALHGAAMTAGKLPVLPGRK
ncbi:uncharacterized protein MKK02DRAFT_42178 [Dioszegia hungarica]|uniref:Uncharacterized protein n=1 Tax=Dioszegia hungarica TaxID=4972 RepID=A0AA38HD22_9TREE|nr:uncharacterized protein MKK02DRAFT_42178 [Dioszegia hungarica]KAI9637807.1 hypothetical protein MKK02DRAFT_42178 [Dioszegia hungarica]